MKHLRLKHFFHLDIKVIFLIILSFLHPFITILFQMFSLFSEPRLLFEHTQQTLHNLQQCDVSGWKGKAAWDTASL